MVTSTDTAVLCGNTPEACFNKYGSIPIKHKACHEIVRGKRFYFYLKEKFLKREMGKYIGCLFVTKIFLKKIFF